MSKVIVPIRRVESISLSFKDCSAELDRSFLKKCFKYPGFHDCKESTFDFSESKAIPQPTEQDLTELLDYLYISYDCSCNSVQLTNITVIEILLYLNFSGDVTIYVEHPKEIELIEKGATECFTSIRHILEHDSNIFDDIRKSLRGETLIQMEKLTDVIHTDLLLKNDKAAKECANNYLNNIPLLSFAHVKKFAKHKTKEELETIIDNLEKRICEENDYIDIRAKQLKRIVADK